MLNLQGTKMTSKNLILNKSKFLDTYDSDLNYSIQWNRYFLYLIGCWPPSIKTLFLEKFRNFILITICNGLLFFLLITCGSYTFLVIKDFKIKMKLIGPMSFCIMAVMKYYYLILHSTNIRWCLEQVKEDWQDMHSTMARLLMLKNAKAARNLAIACAVFMYAGGAFYHGFMPFYAARIKAKMNITSRALTYPVYKGFFDVERSPAYQIVFVTQTITGIIEYNITIGACSLAAAFVMHASGQLDVIMILIEELITNEKQSTKNLKQKMGIIVERHLRVVRFAAKVEDIMNMPSIVEFIGCTLNICHLGYYFITEWKGGDPVGFTGYFILLISHITNIYIFCYIGEQLTGKGEKIGEVSASIKWYNLPGRMNLDVILIIAMSFSPPKVTAGKLFELSLNSFASVSIRTLLVVLQSSLAYLNFLRATI